MDSPRSSHQPPRSQTSSSSHRRVSSSAASPPSPISPSSSPSPSSPSSSSFILLPRPPAVLAQNCCVAHSDPPRATRLHCSATPPLRIETESDKLSPLPGVKNKESRSPSSINPPTVPIPIPATCSNHCTSLPSTPLSAREKPGAYFPRHDTAPEPNSATRESPSARRRRKSSDQPNSTPAACASSPEPVSPKMNPTVMTPVPQIKPRKNGPLKLSSLPRFHPANFQSPNTGSTFTSATAQGSTPRHYSDAQLQLHQYQRELIANATRGKTSSAGCARPVSPRLIPLGSPGPVTPLMLEEEGGYLAAGVSNQNSVLGEAGQKDLVERLIQEESLRHGESQSERSTLSGGRR
ncbi:MAG: hypothetical protein M1813_001641 [Trichoglossum hirsutum]|nr:MAG: hypothetical protein M1813_001641 [Trichoglossum hirsutum]